MSVSITVDEPSSERIGHPVPIGDALPNVRLSLECEGEQHTDADRTKAAFVGGWYPTLATLASKAGWKFTAGRARVLGPCCSGKEPQLDGE